MVSTEASVQYGDITGTVALDEADFEHYEEVLGLPEGWLVLGFSFYSAHTSLGIEGKDFATSALTSLDVWAIRDNVFSLEGGGLPGYLQTQGPLPVAEFSVEMEEVPFPTPLDHVSLLLRGAKRLNIVAWHRAVVAAGLGRDAFVVRERWSKTLQAPHWTEDSES